MADDAYQRGLAALQTGNKTLALALLAEAAQLSPERGDILYNYGVALEQNNKLSQAICAWEKAVKLRPDAVQLWVNLALAYAKNDQKDLAAQAYADAQKHHASDPTLLYHAALFELRCGRPQTSWLLFQKVVTLTPAHQAAWINAGKAAKECGLPDQAETFYTRAIACQGPHGPMAQFSRATLRLSQAQWREGFEDYEARRALPGAPQAPWGLPPATPDLPPGTRLLLWSDQGLGDAVMFLRFVPALRARGYQLSAFVQAPLATLFRAQNLFDAVHTPQDVPCTYDAALAFGSLPFFLQIDPERAANDPYLITPGAPDDGRLAPRKDKGLRIGLVWAGNPRHENDSQRSLPLATFTPLIQNSPAQWYSFQHGTRARDIEEAGLSTHLIDLSDALTDFAATASLLTKVDLLLSVDTAIAHLAGAMGVPVWIYLPAFGVDWRWGQTLSQSFWYPSARLHRAKPGDAAQTVQGELMRFLHEINAKGGF